MAIITALHLSDLHIDSADDVNSRIFRDALIDDIVSVEKAKNLNIDIVLTTGDITNKGGSKEAFLKADTFFTKLSTQIDVTKDKLFFVPGNHDIPRNKAYESLIANYSELEYDVFWESLKSRLNNFIEFEKKYANVYQNFEYGGFYQTVTINGTPLGIIGINTSWQSIDNTDYEKIRIGSLQMDELLKKIRDSDSRELVLALSHHPFDWLHPDERKEARSFITDKRKTNSDFILHGHIHTSQIEFISNPDTSFRQLVSGIGYPDISSRKQGQQKSNQCRYAIYRFNTNDKRLDTWLRISNEAGSFSSDTSLYSSAKEDGHFTLSYSETVSPIKDESDYIIHNLDNIEIDSIPLTKDWIGREDILNRFDKDKYNVIAITGIGGQGKSSLASEYLKLSTRQTKKYTLGLWINCREIADSLHYKIIKVLDILSAGKENESLFADEKLSDTINRFISYLKKNRLLIVFDNVDAYIKKDTEDFDAELKPLMEACLVNTHESLILVTSRLPVNDFRGNFLSIRLKGFSKEEGLEFFRKRGLCLEKNNSSDFCEKVVALTHGHPLWLGLIAGQVVAGKDTLYNIIQNFSGDETPDGYMIKEYFKGIWENLDKFQQNILRYISESTKPLSKNDVIQIVTEYGPEKIKKTINRLVKLGLLDNYEDLKQEDGYFLIHPVVREFIHKTFTSERQRPFVKKVLLVFLPATMIDTLFKNNDFIKSSIQIDIINVITSIETCINSRNFIEAYKLLQSYSNVLFDEGYHHQFIYLAQQILDALDWDQANLIKNENNARFISVTIEKLIYLGYKEKASHYLKRFEGSVEIGTIPYTGFLSMAANNTWRLGEWQKALHYINEAKEYEERWEFENLDYVKALTLRDSGNPQKALSIFTTMPMCSSTAGNMARCHQLMNDNDKTREYLIKSYNLLSSEEKDEGISHLIKTNYGYAYLWIAEYYFKIAEYEQAFAFLFLAFEQWKEFAPGLLPLTESIDTKLMQLEKKNQYIIHPERAKEILDIFLLSDRDSIKQ